MYDPSTVGALGHMSHGEGGGGGGDQRLFGVLPSFTFPPMFNLASNAPFGFLKETHPVAAMSYGNPNGLLMRILRSLQIAPLNMPAGATRDQQEYEAGGGGGDSGIRPLDTPATGGGDIGVHFD